MNFLSRILVACLFATVLVSFVWFNQTTPRKLKSNLRPYENFDFKRTWPDAVPDVRAFRKVMDEVASTAIGPVKGGNPFGGTWQVEGPGNIGGRISAIAVNPDNHNIILTGTPTGGIYKTIDGGENWYPVFDDQAQLSIATIVYDPTDPTILYAGTGDPCVTGFAFMGNGIYKSVDSGESWAYLGLSATSTVSKVCVDPTNNQVIYAATMGLPHTAGPDRGLYKSVDGGQNWSQVLFLANNAGIIDMVMDPDNPQTIYCTGWNRLRNNATSVGSGVHARIYKTIDGGQNWTTLTNGLPGGSLSRINLDMLPSNPQTLYASVIGSDYNIEGFYKTIDGGQSWNPVLQNGMDPGATGGFGWYFSNLRVNPFLPNQLFFSGIELWRTNSGGQNWDQAAPDWWTYEVHADKHDIAFLSADTILLATDGGLYKTVNNTLSWIDIDVIPNTQFYRIALNPHFPGAYYGGAQDNGSTGGNLANFSAWPRMYGGDGFQPAFDPNFSDIYYFETQSGGMVFTDNNGASYEDMTTGIFETDRRNWDMPYFLSTAEEVAYCGTERVYRMEGPPYGVWDPISNDLTDNGVGQISHSISTVSQSPLNKNYLYAGTTDANVWRTLNYGQTWDNVTATLPLRYVTSVRPSPNNANTVYVSHSGYLYDDYIPHIHRSINNGTTWQDISGDLPQAAVNDVLPMKGSDSIIFVATDAGVYGTLNAGQNWHRLGTNMPTLIVNDIEYDASTQCVVAGTHGRSIMTFPFANIIDALPEEVFADGISIYPNPATTTVHVNMPYDLKGVSYKIFSSGGKQLPVQATGANINVAALPAGTYFLVIEKGKHRAVKRFLKY